MKPPPQKEETKLTNSSKKKKDSPAEELYNSPDGMNNSGKPKPVKHFADMFEKQPKEVPAAVGQQIKPSAGASAAIGGGTSTPNKTA